MRLAVAARHMSCWYEGIVCSILLKDLFTVPNIIMIHTLYINIQLQPYAKIQSFHTTTQTIIQAQQSKFGFCINELGTSSKLSQGTYRKFIH